MASFTDQMDAEDSSHSLLERRQSEMGSHYVYESGVYMSMFAATVFVAALVTVGVLMLTLLVALSVMLNSCESRNSGVFKHIKSSDDEFDYCKLFAFHAELNKLDADELPKVCKDLPFKYGNPGQFLRELRLTVRLAESYFDALKANDDHLDVVLMDVDGMFLSNVTRRSSDSRDRKKHVEHEDPPSELILRLYSKLQASGWRLVLFTRKHSDHRNETVKNLISAGYSGWSSLIMRSDDELLMESWEYISDRILQLLKEGYQIAGIISSQMDAFRGSYLGRRNFKLANPAYYNLKVEA
ncbi:uncharacterized protein A4U43_C08F35800 [Asparagus officinalis]|uniref:uncharacterized protein At2g39920 n=1 Tax=Asparagus officinalis TaxID=4686 RepID=UPI00098E0036|nr:uncharacterized protein At2g39920 [Asparagus officinalis]XP_020241095.1 uncharacterized protein At2g39920 [Asparagus officinalis]ONK62003.1 uncharacterized protein A4U43_C08F35800 [Asparagus officinalis]